MSDELREKVARAIAAVYYTPEEVDMRWRGFEEDADAAIALVLEEAAKVAEEYNYLLNLGTPEEGPLSRQDRVCKETREQAAAAIRALGKKA